MMITIYRRELDSMTHLLIYFFISSLQFSAATLAPLAAPTLKAHRSNHESTQRVTVAAKTQWREQNQFSFDHPLQ